MPVEILTFVCGPFATNTYLLRSDAEAWVIDPGIAPTGLLSVLSREQLVPDRVVLTHGHCDHIAGIVALRAAAGPVPTWCPAADAEMLPDPQLNLSGPFGLPISVPPADAVFGPGETLMLGESAWEVLDTSGHTAGGVSLYCAAEGVVLAGDALFAQGIGRTDMPGGDEVRLIANIRANLLSLPPETKVYPGHGPATTIGEESTSNPWLVGG